MKIGGIGATNYTYINLKRLLKILKYASCSLILGPDFQVCNLSFIFHFRLGLGNLRHACHLSGTWCHFGCHTKYFIIMHTYAQSAKNIAFPDDAKNIITWTLFIFFNVFLNWEIPQKTACLLPFCTSASLHFQNCNCSASHLASYQVTI